MVEPEASTTETLTRATAKERNRVAFRRTERLPSRRPAYTIATSSHGVAERSRTTGLVFQAILGAAASLALVGVVASAQSDPGAQVNSNSPDAPPPAVFVQLD